MKGDKIYGLLPLAGSLNVGLFMAGLLLLNGCSSLSLQTVKPVIQPPQTTSAWEKRKSLLSHKNVWNLKSKIALRYDEENWTFGLTWLQRAVQHYAMQVSHPLTGAIVAKLNQNRQGATLLAEDGKTYHSKNAEHLLEAQTGVKLPLQGMQYWVLGITSPQYKVDKLILDNQGRPKIIQQAGWSIQYASYQKNGSNALPRKVVLRRSKDKIYIKLIAKQWQGI